MVQGMAISYTQEISDMKLTAFWGYNPPTQKDGGGGCSSRKLHIMSLKKWEPAACNLKHTPMQRVNRKY